MNYKQQLYLGRWGVHPPVDFLAGSKYPGSGAAPEGLCPGVRARL